MVLRRLVDRLRSRRPAPLPAEVEALRIEFKDRYHSFKLLLAANNKALEVMADIEQTLRGSAPFGMSFVRAALTAVTVSVFSMIRSIERLAPGKYAALFDRFEEIQRAIEAVVARRRPAADERLVIPLAALTRESADLAGSKMANLGEIRNVLGLTVPPGFVVTARAYERFIEYNDLQPEIDRRMQTAALDELGALFSLSAELQQMVIRAAVPPELEQAIAAAWEAMEAEAGGPVTAAMRSSALGEDASGSSFAGQYRSELNVSAENALEAYKQVLASKYSLQAISYRLNKGFRDEDIAMCVGCLAMVAPVASGVAYTCNPVDRRDDAVFIHSAWGLPKAVVDGSSAGDLFVVRRGEPPELVREEIRVKDRKFVCFPEEGVCRLELTGAEREAPALTREQAVMLARTALRIEAHYQAPQDIEWAIDTRGALCLLQCRPLPTEPAAAAAADAAPADGGEALLSRGGITASPGAACGPVFIAEKAADVLAFPAGGVLVIREALPRWAALLSRAAAVVAEQGGVAGHLASVAREFGVPALFGVPGALARLPAGEAVTVDADGRAVFRGRVEARLHAASRPARARMQGSPVHTLLSEASRLIVPLNLLDPAGADFTPANCRTLHDITRFIHEKSVQEMFAFGHDHHFAERSGKQLHHKVPMQWWVLNLDDGFTEEISGKYVRIEQIASVPMLAFWRGFVAIPWEGPPALDGKGMLAVMFQATANRSLNTGVRSRYAERNFFMISRNYCSLSQRLGFHFATTEALIGERPPENYVSFQFKGGAADAGRRLKRVALIAEILAPVGFRVETREDHLLARIEGEPASFMLKRMEVLGYLSLHTRQLDMVMANPAYVGYYRDKYRRDIARLLAEEPPATKAPPR
jgi:pyruvate,water dikinase